MVASPSWSRSIGIANARAGKTILQYHIGTRLPDGRVGLLLDTGTWGNLQGGEFAEALAKEAVSKGYKPKQQQMSQPLEVKGVGKGSQTCNWEVVAPIALPKSNGDTTLNRYTAPVVPNSGVPGLLGLRSMMKMRSLIDTVNKKLYFLGPGDLRIEDVLPPGTESFRLEQSPSGHLLLPISNYQDIARSNNDRDAREDQPEELSLLAAQQRTLED